MHSKSRRRLSLSSADVQALLAAPRRTLPISDLSPTAAKAAAALSFGPCVLLFGSANGGAAVPMPGRRLRQTESIRLQIPFTAGLEFRPKAVAHALGFRLGVGAHAAS